MSGAPGDKFKKQQKRGFHCNVIGAWVGLCRLIAESTVFTILTTSLTVYVLTADDFRLLTTNKPADEGFNMMTLICFLVFAGEIIFSTFGKNDYFMSFFFALDIAATVTLILDLTWVSDLMNSNDDASGNKGSRTAQIGAKTGRVVRVLRLVRILKLYKAVYDARQLQKKKEEKLKNGPGVAAADDLDDLDVEVTMHKNQSPSNRESKVGKKLSELTTRRVICLVLCMMIVLPFLKADDTDQFPTSAAFAADVVFQAFLQLQANASAMNRAAYEDALLRFIYFHNWYTGHSSKCPIPTDDCSRSYTSHLFWVGFGSKNDTFLDEVAALAKVRPSTVSAWEKDLANLLANPSEAWPYNYGSLPSQAQNHISEWNQRCSSTSWDYKGFSLLEDLLGDWEVNYAVRCPSDLRPAERKAYTARLNFDNQVWTMMFFFDLRPYSASDAKFSLGTTLFVCACLCTASIMFTNDADRLVLYPVENMISKVETIKNNPLHAMKVADEEFKVEEYKKAKRAEKENNKFQMAWEFITCSKGSDSTEIMETVILEKTIIKLGSLLALGFGEAGAKIIEHNMHGDSASVDAMVEGTRVECIIGAAKIRDFSTATEVLQAKVMTFVNQIAEIVHGVVNEFHGAANKNHGETFLMIWRMSDQKTKESKLADMSMVAFVRILGAIHRSPVLAQYRGHPGLQQRLGSHCRVNLSLGLHSGWAIEGAVGTEFKIDASYLSPNVSIAETVERATKIYGVSLLVAESVTSMSSPALRAKCRLIDRVLVTGSPVPMRLYVIDLDYLSLTVEAPHGIQKWTNRDRFKVRQFLESEKEQKLSDEARMVDFFNKNKDIAQMRFRFTMEFDNVFNMGYQNYSQGEWQVAQRMLSRTKEMLGVEDGPSVALLRFMERYEFQAPATWNGIRDLGHASSNFT